MFNHCFKSASFQEFPDTPHNLAGYLKSGGTIGVTISPDMSPDKVRLFLYDALSPYFKDVTQLLVGEVHLSDDVKPVVKGKIVMLPFDSIDKWAEVVKRISSIFLIIPSFEDALANAKAHPGFPDEFMTPYLKWLNENELTGELPVEQLTAHREGHASVLADAIRLGVPVTASAQDRTYELVNAPGSDIKNSVYPQDKASLLHGERKTPAGEYDSFGFRDVFHVGRETHLLSYYAVCMATIDMLSEQFDPQGDRFEKAFELEGTYVDTVRDGNGAGTSGNGDNLNQLLTNVFLKVSNYDALDEQEKLFLHRLKGVLVSLAPEHELRPAPVNPSISAVLREKVDGDGLDPYSVNSDLTGGAAVPSVESKSQEV